MNRHRLAATILALAVLGDAAAAQLGPNPLWTWTGGGPYYGFGRVLAGPGDVDGDGVPDIVVAAPDEPTPSGHQGVVRVYSGAAGTLLHVFLAGSTSEHLGLALARVGDLDGDGQADLLVGTPLADANGASTGLVRVYSGADGTIIHDLQGDYAGDGLGQAVVGLADENGDGRPEFAALLPGRILPGGVPAGLLRIYSGLDGAVLRDLPTPALAETLAVLGDLDGDGRGDFAIGATDGYYTSSDRGRVEVYSGTPPFPPIRTHYGIGSFDRLGAALANAGDVDGDGRDDLLAGAPGSDLGAPGAGLIRIFSGRDGTLLHELVGDAPSQEFGRAVAGLGDLDGDGFADFAGGGLELARVFTAPTLPVLSYRTQTAGRHFQELVWMPDGQDPLALTGTLRGTGATPGGLGIALVSVAAADELAFGFLPLLVALDPANLVAYAYYGYDLAGEILVPGVTRSWPSLLGYRTRVQFLEWSPLLTGSNGLRFEVAP